MGRKWDQTAKLYWGDKVQAWPATETNQEREARERANLEESRRLALEPNGIYGALLNAGCSDRHARLVASGQFDIRALPKPVREFQESFPNTAGGSLLACGPPGVGKTALGTWLIARYYAAMVSACNLDVYASLPTPNGWRVRAADLFAAIFAKRIDLLQKLRAASILVVDDLGAVYEHEWPLGEVDGIVDYRWEHQRSTIVTTNLWPHRKDGGEQSFEARYPRIWSRLLDESGPGLVTLKGADRRRGGPKAADPTTGRSS